MLVLSRKMEESIMIGSKIEVTVLSVANGRVKLGIRAPRDVRVLRGELQDESETPQRASTHAREAITPHLAVERKVSSSLRKTHPLHGGVQTEKSLTCCR
jgi:carbon storage regulator CsrA